MQALSEQKLGLIQILVCYLIWGLFPLYWVPLLTYPADQLLAHRIIWGLFFAIVAMMITRQWREFSQALSQKKILLVFLACAILLAGNWLSYLITITTKQVLQASLGYFIAPLVTILSGNLFFKESLSKWKWIAILLAGIGVLWLAILAGQIPFLGIIIALTWGVYGLIRKLAPLPALLGFSIETVLLFPFAAIFLAWHQQQQTLMFFDLPMSLILLLIGSGLITMVPLLLFASASKKIPLSLIGILQYMTPTMQFLIGLFIFDELFDLNRFIGYVWIWCGVILFIFSSLRENKKSV